VHTFARDRRAVWGRLSLALVAIAAAIAPIPPRTIERVYTHGAYARLQPIVTSASNVVPVALLDAVIIAVFIGWSVLAARDLLGARRLGWVPIITKIAVRTMVWAAAAYLVFLVTWGLNYRRLPLIDTLDFSADTVTNTYAKTIANLTVDQVNDLYRPAHERGWSSAAIVDPELALQFERAVRDVGGRGRVVAGRPKRSLFDWYFRRAAISGMTDPFFLETLVASDVLPFERPMVLAHEWSHLAGIAGEGDANFVAWLTCVRGSTPDRYSAWLFLYQEILPALDRRDRSPVAARLGAGPRDDLRAIHDRFARNVNPRVFAAGWKVYDSYLKANRVESGTASYAEVVRLILGVKFEENWTPRLSTQRTPRTQR